MRNLKTGSLPRTMAVIFLILGLMAPNANLLLAATEEQVGIVDNTTVGDFLNETPGDSIPTSFDAQNEQVQGFDDTQKTDDGIAADY